MRERRWQTFSAFCSIKESLLSQTDSRQVKPSFYRGQEESGSETKDGSLVRSLWVTIQSLPGHCHTMMQGWMCSAVQENGGRMQAASFDARIQ